MKSTDFQLPINIVSKFKFTESNYENIKEHFYKIIETRLSFFRAYGVMCPLLRKPIPIKTLLTFFEISMSKDRKFISIDYRKDTYNDFPCSTLIRSIDYGTLYTPPKRIFYPLYKYFRKNYGKYLN